VIGDLDRCRRCVRRNAPSAGRRDRHLHPVPEAAQEGRPAMTVKIVLVYQSLLGIYGDQGNSKVLARRLQWRGIEAEVVMVEPGEELPPRRQRSTCWAGARTTRRPPRSGSCAGAGNCSTALGDGSRSCSRCARATRSAGTRSRSARTTRSGKASACWTWRPAAWPRARRRRDPDALDEAGRHDLADHGLREPRRVHDARPASHPAGARWRSASATTDAGRRAPLQGNVVGTYPHGPVLARNPELGGLPAGAGAGAAAWSR
jgi:hypothetical protein